jgi:hypothetical protein
LPVFSTRIAISRPAVRTNIPARPHFCSMYYNDTFMVFMRYQLGGYLKKTGTHSILLNTYWWNNVTKTGIYRIYQMKYKQITYCRK